MEGYSRRTLTAVEYYDKNSRSWSTIDDMTSLFHANLDDYGNAYDIPYIYRTVVLFASVYIKGGFFIIGGQSGNSLWKTIFRLDSVTLKWTFAGSLNRRRSFHGAIWFNSKLIVAGGRG